MSKKDVIIAAGAAKLVSSFTTGNMQNVPRKLKPMLAKTPMGKVVKKRYNVDTTILPSFDGIKLNVTRFHSRKGCNWDGKNHVIVLVHGFQVQQVMMWVELPLFLPKGYDVVTFDTRTAGLSEGKGIYTMGYNEAKDLGEVCKWVRKEYGDDVVLGIAGQSAGGATVLQYCSWDPNLAFVIDDCGYTSLVDTIHEIQGRLLKFIDWDEFYKRVYEKGKVGDVTYDMVRPIDSVATLDPEVPLLIQHSIPDAYIVIDNADKIYEAKRGKKEIHKYTIAPHAGSFLMHPIKFSKDTKAFMKKYGLLKK